MQEAIIHASEMLTGDAVRHKSGRWVTESDLGRIEDAALIYERSSSRSTILWAGPTSQMPKKFLKVKRKNLRQKHALIPGLIDCHTHLVFAGNRADEFARRCGGETYEQIAKSGGGIAATVTATRNATEAQLLASAILRVQEAQRFGVTTLEIKSGYGLDHESEIKILKVIQKLKKRFPRVTFSTTYLGAHAIPAGRSSKEYLQEMLQKTLPEVARLKLADSCDVFIDSGYFNLTEGRALLKRAKELGIKTRVHADELGCTHSAELAVELGALSADHLLKISEVGIAKLAASQTVAVLLPGTAFYLKAAHAPARRLIDAGARVALATDFNPGTSMTLSLPSIMTIAALYLEMTRSELFAAVTYNAACALGLEERKGSLIPGLDADFAILPFERFEEIYYRFAWAPGP